MERERGRERERVDRRMGGQGRGVAQDQAGVSGPIERSGLPQTRTCCRCEQSGVTSVGGILDFLS